MSRPTNPTPPPFSPIAIVGVSALFPGSRGPQAFWNNILEGRDFIEDVPADHWLVEDYFDADPTAPEKIYARRGAFLPKVPFDPMKYGVPPTALSATDTVQLLALIVAEKVLEDAVSLQFQKVDRSRVSTILGVASATELVGQMAARIQKPHWVKALRDAGLPESQVQEVAGRITETYPAWTENTFPGLLGNVVAGRIANRMDLGGTNCVVDAACASSLAAVSMAVQELQLGHSDLVISGGCDALNDTFMFMCFSKTPALSKSGDCRPFSASADGTMLGEGIGMVALRRLADAERDGDKIYGVIRGLGASSDGRAKSIYAPRSEGQSQAIRRAYEQAGYGPEAVDLVEAHGTATTAGDAAEFEGLRQVFQPAYGERRQRVALGSVKSQIGHTKAAAGIASLFKIVMALHHRVLPPTIKVDEPNPNLKIHDSPFYLNTVARPWVHSPDSPRKGSVSSFGFGGSNFHVALEAYPSPREQDLHYYSGPAELLLFGADDPSGLLARLDEVRAEIDRRPLNTVARRAQEAFDPASRYRLGLLVEDRDGADRLAGIAGRHIGEQPEVPLLVPNQIFYRTGDRETAVAFVFAGQGSQYLNMGAELAMTFPDAIAAWDATADLAFEPDLPLHRVVFPPPAFSAEDQEAWTGRLTRTEWAQPAIGAVALSQLSLLDRLGVKPVCTAGHSYGELVALHAAGVISSAEDLLRLSRTRGERMAAASDTPGGMTAVVAPPDTLAGLLADWGLPITEANINSPGQVVMAGTLEALEAAESRLEAEGISFRRLPVSTGFHSHLVDASVEPFHDAIHDFHFAAPEIPVYATETAHPYPDSEPEIRRQLAEQLSHPVRFLDQVRRMHDDGARIFLEIGPGNVLTPLVAACLEGRDHMAVSIDQKARDGVSAFWNALGHLAVAGVDLDFEALWNDFAEPEALDEIGMLSPVAVEINGTNIGKPYPPEEGPSGRPDPNPEPVDRMARRPPSAPDVANGQTETQPSTAEITTADAKLSAGPATPADAMPSWSTPAPTPTSAPLPTLPAPASAPDHPPRMPDPAVHQALQTMQQHLVDAQMSYQKTLTESHLAFLRASETAFRQLGGVGAAPSVQSLPAVPLAGSVESSAAASVPSTVPGAVPAPDTNGMSRPPAIASERDLPSLAAGSLSQGDGMDAQPVEPSRSAVPGFSAEAFERDLLRVVSEKTGYPEAMLDLGMDLESDLGIDSIKRVEILSALQNAYPVLKTQDTARLTSMRTLGQILDFTAEQTAAGSGPIGNGAVPSPSASTVSEPVRSASESFSVEGFERDLLRVVSEKTGYPEAMLDLGMDLESDLGIDSIKRVEILSALQNAYPVLKTQDTARLTSMRTLGQILDFTAEQTAAGSGPIGNGAVPSPTASTVSEPVGSASESFSVEGFERDLLRVVSEKTGYPEAMLDLGMDLESDLGIDSIKRVEILSALQNAYPVLKTQDTARLTSMRTLGQILDFTAEQTVTENHSGDGAAKPARVVVRGTAVSPTGRALRAVPAQPAGIAMGGLHADGPLVLVPDTLGVAPVLEQLLTAEGLEVELREDIPTSCRKVVHLEGLNDFSGPEGRAESIGVNRRVFEVARTLGAVLQEGEGLFVTVQDTGGAFGLEDLEPERAWTGGLSGLAKTAAREWPDASVKAIDLQRGDRGVDELARMLFEELIYGGPETEVGLRADGTRVRLDLQNTGDDDRADAPLAAGDVVVVSGGARGVTAACLIALARQTPLRLAVLGRTSLEPEPEALRTLRTDGELKAGLLDMALKAGEKPTPRALNRQAGLILAAREVRASLEALTALGSEVRYLSVDITDAVGVAAALEAVRQEWGPVKALVHAAGVLADRHIHEKTDEQFNLVFGTKVDGLVNLLDATRQDPLHHLCAFSSVAARAGNPGQADYAMANEVLNKVLQAERRMRGEACTVKSLNWGPWDGGMVHPGLKAHFEAMGVSLIDLEAGADYFAGSLTRPASADVEVVVGGELGEASGRTSGAHRWLWRIDAQRYPLLDSHRIQGHHVVPMMMVNEWMCRLASTLYPTKHIQAVRDLSVFKGIVMDEAGTPEWFVLSDTASQHDGILVLEILLADHVGRPRYRARVEMTDAVPLAPAPPPALEGLTAWPWEADDVYDPDTIFHGPDFHVIRRLIGQSDQGGVGELETTEALAEPYVSRLTDIGALDGSMQLALLWSKIHWDTPSLPTGFATLRIYRPGAWRETVLCQLVRTDANELMSRGDAAFIDADGTLLAELEGLEMHAVPAESLAPASTQTGV